MTHEHVDQRPQNMDEVLATLRPLATRPRAADARARAGSPASEATAPTVDVPAALTRAQLRSHVRARYRPLGLVIVAAAIAVAIASSLTGALARRSAQVRRTDPQLGAAAHAPPRPRAHTVAPDAPSPFASAAPAHAPTLQPGSSPAPAPSITPAVRVRVGRAREPRGVEPAPASVERARPRFLGIRDRGLE
jgi:hypothetical protein